MMRRCNQWCWPGLTGTTQQPTNRTRPRSNQWNRLDMADPTKPVFTQTDVGQMIGRGKPPAPKKMPDRAVVPRMLLLFCCAVHQTGKSSLPTCQASKSFLPIRPPISSGISAADTVTLAAPQLLYQMLLRGGITCICHHGQSCQASKPPAHLFRDVMH